MQIPREKLKKYLAQLKPGEPIMANDPRYVHLENKRDRDGREITIRGEDWTKALFDCISMSEEPTCQLFSGFSGTGKSTELLRLKDRLSRQGYAVVMVNASDYHDLNHQLTITDLLILIAGAFGDAVANLQGGSATPSYWRRFIDFLKTEIQLDQATFKLGPLDLKFNLRHGNTAFWQKVRAGLEAVVGQFKQHAHAYIQDCVAAVKQQDKRFHDVVVIVDSLERLGTAGFDFEKMMTAVIHVFSQHADLLRLPQCHAIYTVPPYAGLLDSGLSELYDRAHHLPMPAVKVFQRATIARELDRQTGHEPPLHQPGVDAMKAILARRVPLDDIFGPHQDALQRLIIAAGGHVRTLLNMMRSLLFDHLDSPFPLKLAAVDKTLTAFRQQSNQSIRPEGIALLYQVFLDKSLDNISKDHLPVLSRYMDNHLVLCYQNGEPWFDLHPLIRDRVISRFHQLGSFT